MSTATVSLFKNHFSTIPTEEIDFIDVLHRIRGGYWQDDYITYRKALQMHGHGSDAEKKAKLLLPCFCPGARFLGGKKQENVTGHSGIINIDIDQQHNQDIDLPEMRERIWKDRYILAGHLSASGKGLSVYVRINPDKAEATWMSLERYFADEYGVIIDPATKNVHTRMRAVVFDPDAYINEKSAPYTKTVKKAEVEFKQRNYAYSETDIEYVVEQIERARIDLTSSYAEWTRLAFALQSEFRGSGEDYFHRISAFHPKYKYADCSRKYRSCQTAGKVSIASFFWLAKEQGIDIVSPKTRDIVKSARYAKQQIKGGSKTTEQAFESAVRYATEVQGESKESAEKIVKAIFSGQDEASPESKDEIYEFITRDIEALRPRRNQIEDVIELDGKRITDRDVNKIMVDLRTKYGSAKVKRDVVFELLDAKSCEYNPILEFFEKNRHRCPKGAVEKLIDSIHGRVEGMDAKGSQAFRQVFIRKWLLGMVSGWHGTYSLLTLVLTGEQNLNKTKWFRGLLPQDLCQYYAEARMDRSPDYMALMATKAILMDDEFGGKSVREEREFKELSAKQEITIRKPYARMAETSLRIATLCGTTNETDINSDLTGNRRVIPIHVSGIDWDMYHSVDKSDMLIELYHEWKQIGDGWMLTPEEIVLLGQRTEKFRATCPEEDLLLKYFNPPASTSETEFMTTTEVMNEISGKINGSSLKLSLRKVGQALKKHGYEQKAKRTDGGTPRYMWNIERKIAADAAGKQCVLDESTAPF